MKTDLKPDQREQSLLQWVTQQLYEKIDVKCILDKNNWKPLHGDASFRRYFRASYANQSWIAVDSPPASENGESFVTVAKFLKSHDILVPTCLAVNLSQGFFLITDFGDCLLAQVLNENTAQEWYKKSTDLLLHLQSIPHQSNPALPIYEKSLLIQELNLFSQWFVEKYLNHKIDNNEQKIISSLFELLVTNAIEQPQVLVHRDYHCRNLMVVNQDLGVIDFQDALWGPITYDLVSLFKDCYVEWPDHLVEQWTVSYFKQAISNGIIQNLSSDLFLRWFHWMGLQRHLKVLGIFTRLYLRDQKPHYLAHLSRVMNYVLKVTHFFNEFYDFHHWLQTKILPAFCLLHPEMERRWLKQ